MQNSGCGYLANSFHFAAARAHRTLPRGISPLSLLVLLVSLREFISTNRLQSHYEETCLHLSID